MCLIRKNINQFRSLQRAHSPKLFPTRGPCPMCQSSFRRGRTMLRLSLLVIFLTHRIRTAHVTDTPFSNRFDKLYQKLEKLTVAPDRQLGPTPEEKLYEKLDRLNSLSPDRVELTDEDEELLTAMKEWGGLSSEQMDGVVKDLQRMKVERREDISDQEYGDGPWDDEVGDFEF